MDQLRLSPSRINDFTNCPQLYKYRAILNLPEEISLDAERGKLVHAVLEDLFELPRAERNHESALSILPVAWEKQLTEKPELTELITSQQEWMDRASSLLQTYFGLEDPTSFDSTYRELHLEKNLTEQIYLHGYVDRLDVAPTGEVRIVDYKTGKAPKPGWEEKALFQLRVYALLYLKIYGVMPTLLQLFYLGDRGSIKSQPSEKVLNQTAEQLLEVSAQIQESHAQDYWPAKPSRLCDWCNFKRNCPAFA